MVKNDEVEKFTDFVVKPSIKGYLIQIGLLAIFVSLVLVVLGNVLNQDIFLILIFVWVVSIFSLLLSWVIVNSKSMEITKQDISIHVGVLDTKSVVVPYYQITNVNIKRSLLDRILGQGKLEVDTPGSNAIELSMSHLENKDIAQIKESLRKMGVGPS